MKQEIWLCELRGEKFRDPKAVRNEVQVFNGISSCSFANICDDCATKVYNFVMEMKKDPVGLPKELKHTAPDGIKKISEMSQEEIRAMVEISENKWDGNLWK